MAREYFTPLGLLRHEVRRTDEAVPPGWVVQPDGVPLFEDFNVPRAVKHAVTDAREAATVAYLYSPPDEGSRAWFAERMAAVESFSTREGIAVQAWSAFGMDAVVWLCGTEGAVLLSVDDPLAFETLLENVTRTDVERTALAAAHPAVDIVVERGWYSSLDFWSPSIFDRFLLPRIRKVADEAHRYGKRMGYVMTTGVQRMASRLADAGVDVLYFVDPVQDKVDLAALVQELGGRMCLVGGTNALSLATDRLAGLETEVIAAVDALGPTGRFILHPVDALFPDTPEAGLRTLVESWLKHRG
jgi:uroporphyrinogen decarboxylase